MTSYIYWHWVLLYLWSFLLRASMQLHGCSVLMPVLATLRLHCTYVPPVVPCPFKESTYLQTIITSCACYSLMHLAVLYIQPCAIQAVFVERDTAPYIAFNKYYHIALDNNDVDTFHNNLIHWQLFLFHHARNVARQVFTHHQLPTERLF